MAFNPKVAFLANVKHGLIENDKTLEDMAAEMGKSLDSIKTRLYQINAKNACVTPLDKEIVAYLNATCKGFKTWAKVKKIK
ncbi:MAG: hypothetical protein PHF52_08605 [Sulfurospirillaceae bacterium]|nr:hypothetical protein [Sulfurospirillaceae bacterium]